MSFTKQHGEALRKFYEKDPKVAVLAEKIGLTRAQLLDAIATLEQPVFVVPEDYSLEADVAGIERAVQIATEKIKYHAGRARDALEAGGRRVGALLARGSVSPTGAAKKPGTLTPADLATRTRC